MSSKVARSPRLILVAGATGIIGRALVRLLLQAGHDVVGTTQSPEGVRLLQSMGVRPVVVDAFDRQGMFDILLTNRPDVVMHQLASLSESDFALNSRIRIVGTRNLVDAALEAGVRRIVAQSISFVYVPGHGPATEDVPLDLDAPMPRRETVEGVNALEQAVSEVPEAVILRYGTLYGPGTWFDRHGKVAEQVRRGELAADDEVTSFLHVQDAAQAALLALEWPGGTVNIVDDEPARGTEWLPYYARLLEAPPPPANTGRGRGDRGASNTRARHELGWQPLFPTWRKGFQTSLQDAHEQP